jgi:hypothetical protein
MVKEGHTSLVLVKILYTTWNLDLRANKGNWVETSATSIPLPKKKDGISG